GFTVMRNNEYGSQNVGIGYRVMYNATSSGNTAVGYNALYDMTSGANNIAIGVSAGTGLTTGDNNLFIGNNSGPLNNNDDNSIVLGSNKTGLGSNTMVLGNDATNLTAIKGKYVGIGTEAPEAKLHVVLTDEMNVRFERVGDGTQGGSLAGWRARGTVDNKEAVQSDDVLTAIIAKGYDGSNYAAAARIRFYVDGNVNTGSVPARIVMYTTPEGALGPQPRLTIRSNGNVGVNTTDPEAKFHLLLRGMEEKNLRIERVLDDVYGAQFSGRHARGGLDSQGNLVRTAVQEDDELTGVVAKGYDGDEYIAAARIDFHVDGPVSDNLVPGRITFSTANGTETQTKPHMVITKDGLIGLGTTEPDAKVHMRLTSEKNVRIERISDGTTGASLAGWRSRGSIDNLTAVQNGDALTGLIAKGFDGSTYRPAARIKVYVDGNVTSGIVPGKISFQIQEEGGAITERVVIRNNGNVGIGISEPARKLHVSEAIRLEPTSVVPDNPSDGDMYMDDGTNTGGTPKLRVYANGAWHDLW
ncbi:MAG: hypothetical protein GXO27_07300, partial [Chlorobi bacterium]|nr:hypothetical protein [Chlorobiota bacterium]